MRSEISSFVECDSRIENGGATRMELVHDGVGKNSKQSGCRGKR